MSISSDLRKLRLQRAGSDYLGEYYDQIDSEKNDRGAAILAATFLENSLEFAVSRRLPNAARLLSKIFENDGPLSSFDAKITIADALNIYGGVTSHNLNMIKHVRNTFAHASIPISFQTDEVSAACETLKLPSDNPQRYREALPFRTPREKYTTICEVTGVEFRNYAARCVNMRADLVATRCEGQFIPIAPAPLP